MDANPTNPTPLNPSSRPPRQRGNNPNRRPRPNRNNEDAGATEEDSHRPHPPRNHRSATQDPGNSENDREKGENVGAAPSKRRRRRPNPNRQKEGESTAATDGATATPTPATRLPDQFKTRRAQFNPSLTTSEPSTSTSNADKKKAPKPPHRQRPKGPLADDLTSNLTYTLSTPPYPDCPICFSSIHPAQPTWSCSPSIGESSASCCWTPFHLKCIRSWASKSVKDIEDAYAARGEKDKKGEWRCPGCQKRRDSVPTGYWCFCGSTSSPPLTRLATPHSCGNPCSRPRSAFSHPTEGGEPTCDHPCPLPCHPGPCPPCQITIHMRCHCGKDEKTFKCRQLAVVSDASDVRSCAQPCGRLLNCGKHRCERICHFGPCSPCEERVTKHCWCGREEREETCGEDQSERYTCGNVCKHLYRCGTHSCERKCHPQHLDTSRPETCPFDPSILTHCPCGKIELTASAISFLSPRYKTLYLPRTSCTDTIPTCTSPCLKPHPACSHQCQVPCHLDDCPPCEVLVQRSCRCGATRKEIPCSQLYDPLTHVEMEVLCDKFCGALRACGRHQCNRVCCPLAGFATGSSTKGKGRRRAANQGDVELDLASIGGLHECDLVCGKTLSCGNHACEARDHRGACPPCLRSTFEEMVCHCGRTVLEPPIACGTVLRCPFPCSRPPPPCGHPKVAHSCHGRVEDRGDETAEGGVSAGCPPCPHLVSKMCACGRKLVPNVRCSTAVDKVRCGGVCGKLMNCGFHHCERQCHPGECGNCTARCGKARRLCLPLNHPCTLPCHAPAACSEAEACQSLITVTCSCGRIKQNIHCGRSTSNPHSDADGNARQNAPKCNNECAVAKRNARLADALGINPQGKDKLATVTYSDELVSFARSDAKFLALVEKAFADFIHGDKKTQVLPHMPMERRKIVHDLATIYRLDTHMVDQEPHRSVQLLRRIDTRMPTPTLSSYIASLKPPAPNFGKLADMSLRSSSPSWRNASSPLTTATAASSKPVASPIPRGWGTLPTRTGSSAGTSTTPVHPSSATDSRGASPLTVPKTHIAAQSRSGTPSQALAHHDSEKQVAAGTELGTPVPDDWEDDA